MTQIGTSEPVRRFLHDTIRCIERLEVLLLMHRHVGRWWAADALGAELRMPVEHAQTHLEQLCAGNLLEVRIADALLYRYQPGTSWLAELVDQVSHAHYLDRSAVLSLVAAPASGATLFADAFRFRKGRSDG